MCQILNCIYSLSSKFLGPLVLGLASGLFILWVDPLPSDLCHSQSLFWLNCSSSPLFQIQVPHSSVLHPELVRCFILTLRRACLGLLVWIFCSFGFVFCLIVCFGMCFCSGLVCLRKSHFLFKMYLPALKYLLLDFWEGSTGKDACGQTRLPELNPWGPHGRRRKWLLQIVLHLPHTCCGMHAPHPLVLMKVVCDCIL